MGGVTDFEGDAELLQVGIYPVTLMQERGLALCEGADLIVIASVQQDFFSAYLNSSWRYLAYCRKRAWSIRP